MDLSKIARRIPSVDGPVININQPENAAPNQEAGLVAEVVNQEAVVSDLRGRHVPVADICPQLDDETEDGGDLLFQEVPADRRKDVEALRRQLPDRLRLEYRIKRSKGGRPTDPLSTRATQARQNRSEKRVREVFTKSQELLGSWEVFVENLTKLERKLPSFYPEKREYFEEITSDIRHRIRQPVNILNTMAGRSDSKKQAVANTNFLQKYEQQKSQLKIFHDLMDALIVLEANFGAADTQTEGDHSAEPMDTVLGAQGQFVVVMEDVAMPDVFQEEIETPSPLYSEKSEEDEDNKELISYIQTLPWPSEAVVPSSYGDTDDHDLELSSAEEPLPVVELVPSAPPQPVRQIIQLVNRGSDCFINALLVIFLHSPIAAVLSRCDLDFRALQDRVKKDVGDIRRRPCFRDFQRGEHSSDEFLEHFVEATASPAKEKMMFAQEWTTRCSHCHFEQKESFPLTILRLPRVESGTVEGMLQKSFDAPRMNPCPRCGGVVSLVETHYNTGATELLTIRLTLHNDAGQIDNKHFPPLDRITVGGSRWSRVGGMEYHERIRHYTAWIADGDGYIHVDDVPHPIGEREPFKEGSENMLLLFYTREGA